MSRIVNLFLGEVLGGMIAWVLIKKYLQGSTRINLFPKGR